MVELILGGMRSGKSREAQLRADACGWPVTYVATATADDVEMAHRIARHRHDRPAHWKTVEEPLHLTRVLSGEAESQRCLIVDCLTLWLTNWLLRGEQAQADYESERSRLLECLPDLAGRIILVSNETNQGVVPVDSLTRRFCDEAGRLHQSLAGISNRVSLMVAGIAWDVKSER